MTGARANAARVLLAIALPLALAGCGTPRAEPRSSPADRGGVGLEASVWTVRDIDLSIARAFAPYQDEPIQSLPPGVREVLAANGFALVEVPAGEIERLRAGLPDAGGSQTLWLDARLGAPWSEIVLGPRVDVPVIETDQGVLDLDPGRLRLLGRAWPTGGLTEAGLEPRVRVELVAQHRFSRERERSEFDRVRAGPPTPVDEGVVFDRLLIEASLPAGRALVVVPITPGEDWRAQLADLGDVGSVSAEVAGPPTPRYPSLGEAMLGKWAYARSPQPSRAVVVLRALPPARFGLLGG